MKTRLLTDRELSILSVRDSHLLALLGLGKRNRDIATTLSISENAVNCLIAELCQALRVRDRSELVLLWERSTLRTHRAITSWEKMASAPHAGTPTASPPLNAQLLLDLFLPESRCEEFLGDLEERYKKKRCRLGNWRSNVWYYKQVATSLWPLFRAWLRRASKGSLADVLCFALRLVGQVSWANALRKAADEERRRSI